MVLGNNMVLCRIHPDDVCRWFMELFVDANPTMGTFGTPRNRSVFPIIKSRPGAFSCSTALRDPGQFKQLKVRDPTHPTFDPRDYTARDIPTLDLGGRRHLLLRPAARVAQLHHLWTDNIAKSLHSTLSSLAIFSLVLVRNQTAVGKKNWLFIGDVIPVDTQRNIQLHKCMKTITINVSEPVYEDFRRYARKTDRKASELIREAMELFRQQRMQRRTSLRDRRPGSVGGPIQAISGEDDLLGDMLDDARD